MAAGAWCCYARCLLQAVLGFLVFGELLLVVLLPVFVVFVTVQQGEGLLV